MSGAGDSGTRSEISSVTVTGDTRLTQGDTESLSSKYGARGRRGELDTSGDTDTSSDIDIVKHTVEVRSNDLDYFKNTH